MDTSKFKADAPDIAALASGVNRMEIQKNGFERKEMTQKKISAESIQDEYEALLGVLRKQKEKVNDVKAKRDDCIANLKNLDMVKKQAKVFKVGTTELDSLNMAMEDQLQQLNDDFRRVNEEYEAMKTELSGVIKEVAATDLEQV